jgi:hypothetical protein
MLGLRRVGNGLRKFSTWLENPVHFDRFIVGAMTGIIFGVFAFIYWAINYYGGVR